MEVPVPTYTISYAPDGTLQFDPPLGSVELPIALSIHFPLQRTLKEKMQEAQLLFLRSQHAEADVLHETSTTAPLASTQVTTQEDRSIFQMGPRAPQVDAQLHNFELTMQPANQANSKKRPRKSRAKAITQSESSLSQNQHVWDLHSGKTAPKKARRTLGAEEALQVAANRGNVCNYHREHRTKCDPTKCSGNKLFQQENPSNMSQTSSETSSDGPGTDNAETRHIEGHKIAPESNLFPFLVEGDDSMVATNAVSQPIPHFDNLLEPEGHLWPSMWPAADDTAFERALGDFALGSELFLVTPPSDANTSLCGRCNSVHGVTLNASNDQVCWTTEFPGPVQLTSDFRTAVGADHRKRRDEKKDKRRSKAKKGSERPDTDTEDEDKYEVALSGGPGDDNEGGGEHGNPKGDEGGGSGSGDGGAAGGTSGNQGTGPNDPFWGFNGDGWGWYSSMATIILLALRYVASMFRARLPSWAMAARAPLSTTLTNECAVPRISDNVFVSLNNYRSSEDDGDSGSCGGRWIGDLGTPDSELPLDMNRPKCVPLQSPPAIVVGSLDIFRPLRKIEEEYVAHPSSSQLSTTRGNTTALLSLLQSKPQTGTNMKHGSEPIQRWSPVDCKHDLQLPDISLPNISSSYNTICLFNTIRVF